MRPRECNCLPAGYLDRRSRRSAWRRMRDSNSRGVAPNTLSNTARPCPPLAGTVREHQPAAAAANRWQTSVNETRSETKTLCASLRRKYCAVSTEWQIHDLRRTVPDEGG